MKNFIYWSILLFFLACESQEIPINNKTSFDLNSPPTKVTLFAEGLISSGLYERDLAISPDGNEIIYTLGNYNQSLRTLIHLQKENGQWQNGQPLPFSGKYQDIEPFFTADGQTLFFASNRPIENDTTRNDYNIWKVEKDKNTWGTPIPLGPNVNTTSDEFYPSVSLNNNLYFTATYQNGIGKEDIFKSEWTDSFYLAPTPLDTNINSATYEFNAYVSPAEDLIFFTSYGRKDDLGGGDLYFSKKDSKGNWQAAVHLDAPINSNKLDFCPFVDFNRNAFYFSSNRVGKLPKEIKSIQEIKRHANQPGNGMGDIYWLSLDKVVH